jgi:hypothetical protein
MGADHLGAIVPGQISGPVFDHHRVLGGLINQYEPAA